MEKSPPKPTSSAAAAATVMIPASTPVSNLYDSYEFRAISKQVNRAMKGSNSPLSPYSYYLKSASPAGFYSKLQLRRICGTAVTRKRVLCSKTQDPRAKGFVSRLWTKVKAGFMRTNY